MTVSRSWSTSGGRGGEEGELFAATDDVGDGVMEEVLGLEVG